MKTVIMIKEKGKWKKVLLASSRGSVSRLRDLLVAKRLIAIVDCDDIASAGDAMRGQSPSRISYYDPERRSVAVVAYGPIASAALASYCSAASASVAGQDTISVHAALTGNVHAEI